MVVDKKRVKMQLKRGENDRLIDNFFLKEIINFLNVWWTICIEPNWLKIFRGMKITIARKHLYANCNKMKTSTTL